MNTLRAILDFCADDANLPYVFLGVAVVFSLAMFFLIVVEFIKEKKHGRHSQRETSALAATRDRAAAVDEWEANGAAVPSTRSGLVSGRGER